MFKNKLFWLIFLPSIAVILFGYYFTTYKTMKFGRWSLSPYLSRTIHDVAAEINEYNITDKNILSEILNSVERWGDKSGKIDAEIFNGLNQDLENIAGSLNNVVRRTGAQNNSTIQKSPTSTENIIKNIKDKISTATEYEK